MCVTTFVINIRRIIIKLIEILEYKNLAIKENIERYLKRLIKKLRKVIEKIILKLKI